MQVNKENPMADNGSEVLSVSKQLPVQAEDLNSKAPAAGTATEAPAASEAVSAGEALPDQSGNSIQLPRWAVRTIAGVAGTAIAIGIWAAALFAPEDAKAKMKEFLIPNYSNGEVDANRAVVGMYLDLEGVSAENVAAITEGDDSVIAGLRNQLDASHGGGTDVDFYYSQPTEGSEKKYVLFDADAAEDNADEQPNDTVFIPMSGIKGSITLDNKDEVIKEILRQFTPRLEDWGYKPEPPTGTIIDPTTGEVITLPGTSDQQTTGEQPTITVTSGEPPEDITEPPEPTEPATSEISKTSTSTSTEKPTTKTEGNNSSNKLILGENLKASDIARGNFLEEYNVSNPKKKELQIGNTTLLVTRKPYYGKNEATYTIYKEESNGVYSPISTIAVPAATNDAYDMSFFSLATFPKGATPDEKKATIGGGRMVNAHNFRFQDAAHSTDNTGYAGYGGTTYAEAPGNPNYLRKVYIYDPKQNAIVPYK